MVRYNTSDIYAYGALIAPLNKIREKDDLAELRERLVFSFASFGLQMIVDHRFIRIRQATKRAAETLTQTLSEIQNATDLDDPTIQSVHKMNIGRETQAFETLFRADLLEMHLYGVPQVLGYDTSTLIEEGEKLIEVEYQDILSQLAVSDLRDATRCLALDISTACVFHINRATEEVMRRYHQEFIGPLPTDYKDKTMGALYAAFKTAGIGATLLADIKHVKDHYRNFVSHPDVTFTSKQARTILPSCVGVINQMLDDIYNNPKPAKDSSIIPPIPPPPI